MEMLLPVSISRFLSSSTCDSVPTYQILSELGYSATDLWCCVDFPKWRPYSGPALPSQIYSAFRFYEVSLRYYYFRFLKANGRHSEILLPVFILIFSPPSACDSPSAYTKCCPNSMIAADVLHKVIKHLSSEMSINTIILTKCISWLCVESNQLH